MRHEKQWSSKSTRNKEATLDIEVVRQVPFVGEKSLFLEIKVALKNKKEKKKGGVHQFKHGISPCFRLNSVLSRDATLHCKMFPSFVYTLTCLRLAAGVGCFSLSFSSSACFELFRGSCEEACLVGITLKEPSVQVFVLFLFSTSQIYGELENIFLF